MPSFERTVIWPSPQAARAAAPLLAQLPALRSAVVSDTVPAIIDETTANGLLLHTGSTFTIKIADDPIVSQISYEVAGVIDFIPTINKFATSGNGNGFAGTGGVLVDYQSFSKAYAQSVKKHQDQAQGLEPPTTNYVWLRTRDDAGSLASVRTALEQPAFRLNQLIDRRVLLATLQSDPLYLVLAGLLGLGTITVLLLAVLGDLLTSWLSARTRVINFALLRALGTTSSQVALVLIWEQAIVYVNGLLLGLAFGALLSVSVIPALTFTDLSPNLSSEQFFALQSAVPTRIVVPPSLPVLVAVVVGVCVAALLLMVRVVSQPSLGQSLRLNED